jgi:hypothetical protein
MRKRFFIKNTIMSYLPTNAKYIMRIVNRQTMNVCYREYITTTATQCIKDYFFIWGWGLQRSESCFFIAFRQGFYTEHLHSKLIDGGKWNSTDFNLIFFNFNLCRSSLLWEQDLREWSSQLFSVQQMICKYCRSSLPSGRAFALT